MKITEFINEYAASPLLTLFLCVFGAYFLFALRLNPRGIPSALRRGGGDGISAAESLSVALAGTLGVGNVSGVAVAIYAGGAGAVFWMMISALLGAPLKYCEAYLSVLHRRGVTGGSPYYASDIAGKKAGTAMAALCLLTSFCSGPFIQCGAASAAVSSSYGVPGLLTGAVFAAATLLTVSGGIKRVSSFSSSLMPLFCAVFAAMSLTAVCMRINEVPGVIMRIFREAFGFRQAAGGFSGALFASAVRAGLSKGVFSHEAGCGTSSFSHAASSVTDPSAQGMIGVLEVLFDTVVFGGLTALVVLLSQAPGDSGGTAAAISAYSSFFGTAARHMLTALTVFFAFASMICWAYYGTVCSDFICPSLSPFYKVVYSASAVVGAVVSPALIWCLSDICCACTVVLNCAVMFRARKSVIPEKRKKHRLS